MKAEELMIGDWVYFKAETPKICQVVSIDTADDNYIRQSLTDTYYTEDCFEPIPLTPEILEKNGFELSPDCDYEYIYEDEDRTIICCPKGTACINACGYISVYAGCLSVEDMPIDFVHELQHALKLCEFEIEIEL